MDVGRVADGWLQAGDGNTDGCITTGFQRWNTEGHLQDQCETFNGMPVYYGGDLYDSEDSDWDDPYALASVAYVEDYNLRGCAGVGSTTQPEPRVLAAPLILGHKKTLAAALQLQHDAGLVLSNIQVLQQFATSLNRTSSEVMQVTFGRAPFPADAMQRVVPSYRVRRAAHYMAAMGLWHPPSSQGIRGPLPSATMPACGAATVSQICLSDSIRQCVTALMYEWHVTVQDYNCVGYI